MQNSDITQKYSTASGAINSAINERDYMSRAIELAGKGAGWTNPNPMVGAVIVKEGRIIGEGYHQKCGEPHAERNALASLTESAEGATMYVTLEPCCHYGKTPPCTEAILKHKIARVVIGSRDPNPLVAGKGAEILRKNGVIVEQDFMRKECDAINPVFFHYITTGKPYVVMKYAMTLDGKIAAHTGASKWITGEVARQHVHSLRGKYSAIMVGIGTVLADDPLLNCRSRCFCQGASWDSVHVSSQDDQQEKSQESSQKSSQENIQTSLEIGFKSCHQPTRIIVDSHLRIPTKSRICRTAKDYPTVVVCSEFVEDKARELEKLGIRVLCFPQDSGKAGVNLQALMKWIGDRKMDSVLIEGGGKLNEAALRAGIVHHVCAYIAPKLLGGKTAKTPVEGLGADTPDQAVRLENFQLTTLGQDILIEYDVTGGFSDVHGNY